MLYYLRRQNDHGDDELGVEDEEPGEDDADDAADVGDAPEPAGATAVLVHGHRHPAPAAALSAKLLLKGQAVVVRMLLLSMMRLL